MSVKIGFIGLSHLGLSYLAAMANKGFEVLGYNDLELRPIFEPGLDELILKNKKNIKFSKKTRP
ncbi:MAG: hypothetical protein ACKOAD_02120, partial [Gammaproteobacteria bacterium]